ncbi:MAG: hypothetical protein AB8G15_18460 [Saprospiraceae bacterium]
MKKARLLFFLLIGNLFYLGTSFAQKKSNVLELEFVMKTFFDTHQVFFPVRSTVTFSKKKDGYYIDLLNEKFKVYKSEKYYDLATKTFHKISVFKYKENPTDSDLSFIRDGQKVIYNTSEKIKEYKERSTLFKDAAFYPYFGYAGYYNDIIKLFAGEEKLLPNDLYCLCKSYSTKLGSKLTKNAQYGLEVEEFENPDSNFLTPKELIEYQALFGIEKKCYQKLKTQYPAFITNRGDAKEKYGHIIMQSFVQLIIRSEDTIANQLLEDSLYSKEILSKARKTLNSCSKNSILLTRTEIDTYPLYYLQAAENLRTDITLINTAFIVRPNYFSFIYKGPFESTPIQSTIPLQVVNKTTVFYNRNSGTPNLNISAADFLSDLENDSLYLNSNSDTNHFEARGNKIVFNPKDTLSAQVDTYPNVVLPTFFFIDLVCIIDILSNNDRDVLVSSQFPKEYFDKFSAVVEKENYYKIIR